MKHYVVCLVIFICIFHTWAIEKTVSIKIDSAVVHQLAVPAFNKESECNCHYSFPDNYIKTLLEMRGITIILDEVTESVLADTSILHKLWNREKECTARELKALLLAKSEMSVKSFAITESSASLKVKWDFDRELKNTAITKGIKRTSSNEQQMTLNRVFLQRFDSLSALPNPEEELSELHAIFAAVLMQNSFINYDPSRRVAQLKCAFEHDSSLFEAQWYMGLSYFDQGKYQRSTEHFETLFSIDSSHSMPYVTYGDCLKPEYALEQYNKALSLYSNNGYALTRRGIAQLKLGKKDEAIADFKKATKVEPLYAESYNELAKIHIEAGDLDSALALLNKAEKMDSSNTTTLQLTADIYYDTYDQQKALAYYKLARKAPIRLVRRAAEIDSRIGILSFSLGDFKVAEKHLEKATDMFGIAMKERGYIHYLLALTRLELGQKDYYITGELKTAGQKGIPEAYLILAHLYREKNDLRSELKALKNYQKKLNPSDEDRPILIEKRIELLKDSVGYY